MARARAADALYLDGDQFVGPRKVKPPATSWVESVLGDWLDDTGEAEELE